MFGLALSDLTKLRVCQKKRIRKEQGARNRSTATYFSAGRERTSEWLQKFHLVFAYA